MEIIEKQSTIHFLPAMHGDAFFIHCFRGDEEGWIIVDGGASSNGRHNPFVREIEGLPKKDLMILTHHDDDHLTGIRAYVKSHEEDKCFPIERLWVNCARHINISIGENLSAGHASNLAEVLNGISERQSIRWMDAVTEEYKDKTIRFADIDILNPTKDMLERFIPIYEQEAGIKKEPEGADTSAQRSIDDYEISLEELATREKDKPSEENYSHFANMVSIAFIFICDGLSGLMLGDSFPDQIVEALKRRGKSKDNKLKVDFVKVAHHGSRNNISNELLDMIDCKNYLIPTNGGGANSYHPDREAMANILCHEGRTAGKVYLHFNYKLAEIEARKHFKLFHEDEPKKYNFEICEPNYETERSQYKVTLYT